MPRSGRQTPRYGMELLRPERMPLPGAPHPLIRQRYDLLVSGRALRARCRIRSPCGTPAPGWCAAPPSPPASFHYP